MGGAFPIPENCRIMQRPESLINGEAYIVPTFARKTSRYLNTNTNTYDEKLIAIIED